MATKHYAWSNLYDGGKTKEITLPNKSVRTVVLERNVTEFGSEVTKSKLGVTDEEWDALIEAKVIRTYPTPKNLGENESPASFVERKLLDGEMEFNPDVLLEMSLAHNTAGAFAEELEEEEASELAEA